MFFYRRPIWVIGFKVLLIILLIAGGTFFARSAFQAGYMQGAAVDAGEITAPFFYPHAKGYALHPGGGFFLPILAIFLGGILIIKLITSIVGLVMFKRWKSEGGPEWEDWQAWKGHKFQGHHPHWGPYPCGPWGAYPIKEKPMGEDGSAAGVEEDAS